MNKFEQLWVDRLKDIEFNPELPEWAIGLAKNEFVLGAQLGTKDGRRVGNGYIIDITESAFGSLYTVLTDAGNIMCLSISELEGLYHNPTYISDVDRVIERFGRFE